MSVPVFLKAWLKKEGKAGLRKVRRVYYKGQFKLYFIYTGEVSVRFIKSKYIKIPAIYTSSTYHFEGFLHDNGVN